ncbi:helix-turn-helix protein [Krasilnikovia cinnamomea]|uniref:Helix-turn-helix protein n=1 Tax=Krasilnikovia cinnamomea TaxID=349313 RepID=A0A4V2G6N0_9ACTN|nr:helix-turn-helix transcriptional regulator [Krasilnikovia cinnamomea]RZU49256.1 helix-turn-helix protein [Krasilnikovia cinnamomea]
MHEGVGVPTDASAQRLRIGADLRRLRETAQLSGEQVARTLGWSQPKVSRIEAGRTAFTVKDVASLLALYGTPDDVRAELLGATAEDTGEGAWIVRAGGFPHRQDSIASLESGTKRIRHHQPVVVPGLLQTYEYARAVASAAGAKDPDAIAAARMRRQEMLAAKAGPKYEVVLDARALLLGVGDVDLMKRQLHAVAERAETLRRLDLRVIPLGAVVPVFSTVGFTIYEFQADESPSVAWIEAPTGDVYFSATEDVNRYAALFKKLRGVALTAEHSIGYLRSLATDVRRYVAVP